ncbi:MAG: COR domain-containing protein [Cyanobacteria bacterium P01_G01_bin.67]
MDDNPIEEPPLEIVKEGIKSIRDYFQQLTAGRDYIYEAKLIIVGEGGAGKTTLAKKIQNPAYELKKDETSTEGIDVITWKFDMLEKERGFQVNIWDFGGQEIYHATYQFFLTKRSLYALVADTRKEDTDFYYWLNVVELSVNNSPVLIVKNEKQDRHREININALRGQFSNLKETLATNLESNRGLPEIITNIQDYIKKLPHIGQVLPKTWVQVREALEQDSRNYIPLQEYLNICEQNGFTKHSDKLQLSQYLHDLGVCLHFQDKEDSILYKTVILKPKWGTDAVYTVLDNKQVINHQGCFTRKDLKDIWHEDKYASMRGELLELMSKFQLCYEIPSCPDTFISPQLLRENQPEYDWNSANNLILRYAYPDFMPKGIISRFIVVMHQYIERQDYVWKSGVRLIQDDTKAEIIEDYGKREIRVRVVGNNKRNLMTIITHELDKINNSFNRRLKYQKLIPCNCQECQPSQKPYLYEFRKLLERVANNKLTIECGNPPYYEVQVLSLIDNAIDIRQLVPQNKLEGDKSFHFYGDNKQLVLQLLEQGNVSGDLKMSDRKININEGNYNEKIDGDYIQGDKVDKSQVDKSDQSRNFQVGDVGGDFSPTNSSIMSDDAQISTSSGLSTQTKGKNWGLIITVAAIVISACISGLFNEEVREFLGLSSSPETPEEVESAPTN